MFKLLVKCINLKNIVIIYVTATYLINKWLIKTRYWFGEVNGQLYWPMQCLMS